MNCLKLTVAIACLAFPTLCFGVDLTTDSLATVKKNVEEDRAVIVDVREKSEWDRGHVKGAIFAPLSGLQADLQSIAKQLPKDKVLYTHCVVGKRSVTVGNVLASLGYEVRPLKAGYKELIQAGFPSAR